jgi:hypothetical protein
MRELCPSSSPHEGRFENRCPECETPVEARGLCLDCARDVKLTALLATQDWVELQEILFAHVIRSTPQLIRFIVTKADDDVKDMLIESYECEKVGGAS